MTLDEIREDEIRFRRRGYFEAANSARIYADELERTGSPPPRACCYFDRGSLERVTLYTHDNMAFLKLNNGTVHALTPTRAQGIACALLDWTEELGL